MRLAPKHQITKTDRPPTQNETLTPATSSFAGVRPRVDNSQLNSGTGVTEKETYVRETLSVGVASIYIYRHESLTPAQVLNLLIESYKAWAVNRSGGRR
jgi:hypothetical protein